MLESNFLNQIQAIVQQIPANSKIVMVGGCFDLLHFGHVYFLNEAEKLGDYLLVILESDEFIIQKKKRQPIHNQNERQTILESLKSVDLVIPLPLLSSDDDYLQIVKTVSPSIIAVSQNDPQLVSKTQQAKTITAQIRVVDLMAKFSTSRIIKQFVS